MLVRQAPQPARGCADERKNRQVDRPVKVEPEPRAAGQLPNLEAGTLLQPTGQRVVGRQRGEAADWLRVTDRADIRGVAVVGERNLLARSRDGDECRRVVASKKRDGATSEDDEAAGRAFLDGEPREPLTEGLGIAGVAPHDRDPMRIRSIEERHLVSHQPVARQGEHVRQRRILPGAGTGRLVEDDDDRFCHGPRSLGSREPIDDRGRLVE